LRLPLWTFGSRSDLLQEPLSSPLEKKPSSLGEAIRSLRVDVGLTQEEVAKKAGVHFTQISNLELGKASPEYDTLQKLARGLDLPSPSYILILGEIYERRNNRG